MKRSKPRSSGSRRRATSPADETGGRTLAMVLDGPLGDSLAPQRELQKLPETAKAADNLLASLADEAIHNLLSRQNLPREVEPSAPTGPDDDLGPPLSSEELAALSEPDEPPADVPVLEAPMAMPLRPRGSRDEQTALGADPLPQPHVLADPDLGVQMPSDEELEALLSQPLEEEPAAVSRSRSRAGEEPLSEAAAALAAELDEESPSLEPASRGRHAADDEDADAIQAEGAIEARGSVNLSEPEAPDYEEASIAPVVLAAMPAPKPARTDKPWWVMPLVWLNAPLAGAPQTVREAVGKVALITLLNAAAVLVYVLVIRR